MRTLALAVALALAGCGACPSPSPSPSTSPSTSPSPIDVDSADEGALVHVTLTSEQGTLLVRTGPSPDDEPAPDAGDDDACRVPTPGERDTLSHASWDEGLTVLAARSPDRHANGTAGGWIGTLLPLGDGSALAVRSWTVDWAERGLGERDDELVRITLPTITATPVYVPGGRLRMLGLVHGQALLLLSSRDGTHRVVAVSPEGAELARTEAITLPDDALDTTVGNGADLALPWALPIDATSLAVVCTASRDVCTLRFDGSTLALARAGVTLGEDDALVVSSGVGCIARGDDCTPLAGGATVPCEAYPITDDVLGLPVDGALTAGVEGDALVTETRLAVALDPHEPETDDDADELAHAGVILLDAPEGGATDVGFDLIVRGDHVAVSYTRVEDTRAGTQRRDLGLALPPRSLEAVPVPGQPRTHHVRIATTFPIHYSHDCWQGFWVIRAWIDQGGEAFTSTYAEYGYCD